MKALVEAFQKHGCTGLTIWTSDQGYQVSLRKSDGQSWSIEIDEFLDDALERAVDNFNEFHRKQPARKGKATTSRARRDEEDLI